MTRSFPTRRASDLRIPRPLALHRGGGAPRSNAARHAHITAATSLIEEIGHQLEALCSTDIKTQLGEQAPSLGIHDVALVGIHAHRLAVRSEERSEGKECVRTC